MAYGQLGKRVIQSWGRTAPKVLDNVGGAIKRQPVGHRLIGNQVVKSSGDFTNDVISRATSAKTSSTSLGQPVFIGNRHPGLSPGVEDFTGLDIPEEALAWFEGGGRTKFLNETFLNVGKSKKNPKFITIQDLLDQYEANPTTALKNKIDGYKSGLATPWAKDANDVIVYQKGNPPALTAELKETNPELYSAQLDKSLEFHHKSMKAVEYEIFKKMDELIASNKATVIDLINLHNLGKQFGIEAGSRQGAGFWMHRGPHNWMHKGRTTQLGIEPITKAEVTGFRGGKAPKKKPPQFTKMSDTDWDKIRNAGVDSLADVEEIYNWGQKIGYNKAIKKWKVRKAQGKTYISDGKSEMTRLIEEIRAIKNPADLTQFRKEFLQNTSVPMTVEAELIEAAAKKETPMFLHESSKWAKKGLGGDLDAMRLKEKTLQHKESLESWPPQPVTENPEYEELIGDVV